MGVTVNDKNNVTATKATDTNGKITVPVKTSSGGSLGGSSGGGGGSSISNITNVKVVDKDGKTVNVTKSIKNNDITLTLPNGTIIDGKNYYIITVTDGKGHAKADMNVRQVVRQGRIAFEIATDIPNAETKAAIQEMDDIISGKVEAKKYTSTKEFFDDLDS